jgi:hypothetical protein
MEDFRFLRKAGQIKEEEERMGGQLVQEEQREFFDSDGKECLDKMKHISDLIAHVTIFSNKLKINIRERTPS